LAWEGHWGGLGTSVTRTCQRFKKRIGDLELTVPQGVTRVRVEVGEVFKGMQRQATGRDESKVQQCVYISRG